MRDGDCTAFKSTQELLGLCCNRLPWAAGHHARGRADRGALLVTKQRTYRGGHLPPLQNHVLGDPSVRVHIHPLIFIAHQKLHAVRVGENDDCMGLNAALDLRTEAGRLGSSPGPWWYSGILSAR